METQEAAAPETVSDTLETPPPSEPAPVDTDWQAEANKWKAAARKHEDRAKANFQAAKELETLKESQLSDTDKAVKEAEARGQAAAIAQFGQKIAAAELKAALAGLIPDPAGVIEDLNLAKFVTDTGDVDVEAVAALREKYALLAPAKNAPAPNLHQGRQGPPVQGQITRAELERMTPDEITAAMAQGRLDEIRGITH
jgi:hypothetical protein